MLYPAELWAPTQVTETMTGAAWRKSVCVCLRKVWLGLNRPRTIGGFQGHKGCLSVSSMQSCFSAGMLGPLDLTKLVTISITALFEGSCSRTEVQVMTPPPAPPALVTVVSRVAPIRQTAAERLVEIDRLLAAPVTGRSEDSDRRTLLRAERASLVDSGQVPHRTQSQLAVNRNRVAQPDAPVAAVTLAAQDQERRQRMVAQYKSEADESRRKQQLADREQQARWEQESRIRRSNLGR